MPDLIDQGLDAHRRGDLAAAEACYASAVAAEPNDADAHNLLGVCRLQRGDAAAARESFESATRLDPAAPEFHFHLGRALQATDAVPAARLAYRRALDLEQTLDGAWRGFAETSQVLNCFDDAAGAWRRVLDASPDDAKAWNNLGLARLHLGDWPTALDALREALRLEPTFVLAWSNLLRVQEQAGDVEAMMETADRLIAADPGRALSYVQKAAVLQRAGRTADAIDCVASALKRDPNDADAHYAMGVLLAQSGEHGAAMLAYRRAAELCPGNPLPDLSSAASLLIGGNPLAAVRELTALDAKYPGRFEIKRQLAEALSRAAQPLEAIAVAREAVALRPNDSDALSSLGQLLGSVGEQAEAEVHLRNALRNTPWPPAAAGNLATMLALRGELAEGIALHRELIGRFPKVALARSNFLLHLNGDPDAPPADVYQEHLRWAEHHAPPVAPTFANDRDPDRPLRIGYVSPDFREHSVAFFFEPILAHHDRRNVTVVCYDNVMRPDGMTAHLNRRADEWRRIVGVPDAAVAELIRRDRIDVLIDLAGHTGDNRLGVFALRPAPVQVTYLGYPNTTGMPQIDYRITDAYADPPGFADTIHSETLVRLPDRFLNYRPPIDSPPAGPLPALANGGAVTFGSFNALSKYNRVVFDAWSAVLRRVGRSTLLMKANGLGDPDTRRRITAEFARRGIDAERLQFAPRTRTYGDHVGTYARVDIGLDTFPYNGTTTTCEALWMGVPVVTTAGPSHVARVGVSLMSNLGLADWIAADDVEAFADLAAAKAGDLDALAALRADMRRRMSSSPLMDPPRMCADLEAAYRQMWRTWCERSTPSSES